MNIELAAHLAGAKKTIVFVTHGITEAVLPRHLADRAHGRAARAWPTFSASSCRIRARSR